MIRLQIGIGYGECGILYVGGVFGRNETLTVGEALMDALKSEGQATTGGQVIVANSAFSNVLPFFRAENEIIDDATFEKFYLIDLRYKKNPIKISSDTMKLRSLFNSKVLSKIQGSL